MKRPPGQEPRDRTGLTPEDRRIWGRVTGTVTPPRKRKAARVQTDSAHVEVEDLLTGGRFFWYGKFQQVHLDPRINPCAIWRVIPPGIGQRT